MRVRAQALTSRRPNRYAIVERPGLEATTLPPIPPSFSDDWGYTWPGAQPLPLIDTTTRRTRSPVFRSRLGSQESLSSDASTITINHDPPEPLQEPPILPPSSFQPSPLPWGPLDFSPPTPRSSRTQQKRPAPSSSRVHSSSRSPFAGR